jgi:hypothetical protein
MATKKTTGKKLADMMYGNPEGAAFGITPFIGKRREDRQDREAAKNFPVDLGRGAIAGALGMFGDMESIGRLPYELYTGNESPTFLPTSEDVLKRIPFGSDSPAGQFASGLGTLAGGSAPFGPAVRGVKAVPGALKTAARNVSAPRTLNPQAGVVRVGQPSAPQMEALRLAQKRAALPIERGGLGLPANNTPEQRAAAMGFDRDTYHGSLRDIKKLDPRLGSTESHAGRGVYSTDSPEDASLNYASIYGPDVSGRVERGLEERDKDFRKIYGRMRDEALTPRQQEIILRNAAGADNLGVVYPLRVRSDKSIHLDAPEANPVLVGPFEQYDEVADAYVDTPHTAKFREALDEFGELGGEANPIYEVVQDGDGPVPARDVFNAVKKTGNETGLYDPYTGDIVSGGVAAGDFVKHFGIDEIRHTPEFRNQQLNIGNEHTISLNPDNVRSRFAAFDPFRKDVATAAAMGVLAPDLLAKEKDEDKKKDKDKEAKKARGGPVHFSDNPDVMQLELAGGGLVRKGIKAIRGAAESAGQKAPVLAEKDLTTLQDAHTNLGDRVRAGAMEAQKMMEGFGYQYDKGQRVFTKDSAGKNKPPYTILNRTRVGNQVMREDHPEFGPGMGRPIIDPQTGKAMRTPYEPGYRVRMERGPDDWSEFEIPEKAIVGNVEMAAGGAVHMAAGGLARGLKALKPAKEAAVPLTLPRVRPTTQDIMEAAERVGKQQAGEFVRSPLTTKTSNLAGRSKKEVDRLKKLEYKVTPIKDLPEMKPYEAKIGEVNIALPGDQTISDMLLESVDGIPIGTTSEGGALFGRGRLSDPEETRAFWASNIGPADLFQKKVTEIAQLYDTDMVTAYHLAMGQMSNNFAQHMADASIRAIDYSKLNKDKMNAFDRIVSKGYVDPTTKERVTFENWPGIASPEDALQAMKEDPKLRKWFNNRMKTEKVTKPLDLPNAKSIEYAMTEPELRDMEINLTGLSAGRMKPGAELIPDSAHQTYSHDIPGTALGRAPELSPFAISFPDATAFVREKYRPQDFTGTIQKVFPHQVVDEAYLEDMYKYYTQLRKVRGYKKGGAVRKAAGGEITADDLILEERKL